MFLTTRQTSTAINKFHKKISRKEAVRAAQEFAFFISDESVKDIKIKNFLKDSGALIDVVTEKVKEQIKKTRMWISWSFASTFSLLISTASKFFSSKKYKLS